MLAYTYSHQNKIHAIKMTTLIEFERVSRYFLDKQALVNIDCKINEGEFIFLTGHSGAGKSTFLKLIALQDKACEGL